MSGFQKKAIDNNICKFLCQLAISNIKQKNLFLTGGTGFFGFWLLTTLMILNQKGADLQVTVLSRDPSRFLKKHKKFIDLPWLSFHRGDVRDFRFPSGQHDLLIHAATDTSVAAHAKPLQILDDIVTGSRRVLDFAVGAGVRRVLLASSGAVYGPQPAGMTHIPEDARCACPTDNPASAYGEGKRFMEMLGTLYAERYGLEVVGARCFAFVGAGLPLNAHFAIGNFIRDALWSDAITVNGDGTPVRSYLYGGDLAIWLLTLLAQGTPRRIYNVGSDVPVSIIDLAHLVRDTLSPGKPVSLMGKPGGGGGGNHYVPDIGRAREELGLGVWTPLQDAIRFTALAAMAEDCQCRVQM